MALSKSTASTRNSPKDCRTEVPKRGQAVADRQARGSLKLGCHCGGARAQGTETTSRGKLGEPPRAPRAWPWAKSKKADSTLRSSQAVPHPSTNRALRRLTSEVRRDPVHSTRYGRQRQESPCAVAGGLGRPKSRSRARVSCGPEAGVVRRAVLVWLAVTTFCPRRCPSPKLGDAFALLCCQPGAVRHASTAATPLSAQGNHCRPSFDRGACRAGWL